MSLLPHDPIIEAMARAGLRVITTRQERVAGNMADGVSRSTNGREIGVFTVQALAGSENAFAGVAQAHTDSSPVLFLPGHPGTSYVDQPPTFDSKANYAATTKMAQKVLAADHMPIKLRQAFTALRSGRPQPVMLELLGDACAGGSERRSSSTGQCRGCALRPTRARCGRRPSACSRPKHR